MTELSNLGCTYSLVQNTLNYNFNYDSTNNNIAIHVRWYRKSHDLKSCCLISHVFKFTGGFKDSNGITYPANVFANGTITSTSFPLYSIITRGDLFSKRTFLDINLVRWFELALKHIKRQLRIRLSKRQSTFGYRKLEHGSIRRKI